ncbi:ABC-2 family transporter protein [Bacillus sp. THAF10]|uniref:ABC transporter permease n=1 Tax=Bacillus sp. THAF10 TaxID=2587848 RepID=UPI001268BAC9|nr:ABC-2 family transporter protein [Bacillus sp. THAF10]
MLHNVRNQIEGEVLKIGRNRIIVIGVSAVILNCMVSIIYFSYNQTALDIEDSLRIHKYLSISHFFTTFILILFSAVLWNLLVSLENKRGTWSIILTQPIRKSNLILSKHLLFLLIYTLFIFFTFSFSLVYTNFLEIKLDFEILSKSYVVYYFIGLTIPYSQLIFHIFLKNGIQAMSLSVVWIFLLMTKSVLPKTVSSAIPIYYLDQVLGSIAPDQNTIIKYIILTTLLMCIMFFVSIRKNYYDYY